ncbi:transcriptional regulator containing an amidase domain and an arac-type DNA-binding hth domain [Halogeometricum borinquense DSM 11551]|uniref:transcriptional regulator containing an amidase domain and an AraC-type DNA-binding HTH domain n=1 Tax=Halogeometricum borinquense (strain ATCC 700274 / DSM 11551 / JCM 10706 / KCTC 4070 / PR3) TaxID=469382 RepID=E4NT26_HALBP|nr:DJ-1/PfpI family protein [Halogeometricum borinquense]ADQ67019.1 transcriptional regulator containing an amidase domain and an AraC-type DNA-binding HTH domain [Halogeometricum borinquense DSM 11551]ELY29810.1 transcriptional regulator containing an amidase domain and an arac-type DNA-binding hth domain [Halogeometricum borinquense DSM 11551]
MHSEILLYDGFDELDAVGPYEVFETAGAFGADCSARLVTLDARETVTASHGLRVGTDGTFNPDSSDADVLLVPGGGWSDPSEPGAGMEAENGEIPDAIAAYAQRGGVVAGVCTGGMLLAHAGVLDGRPAVTHATALDDLREMNVDIQDTRFVDDGDVLTAGGVTSGLDLALHLVERECGLKIADQVAAEIEYERQTEPARN